MIENLKKEGENREKLVIDSETVKKNEDLTNNMVEKEIDELEINRTNEVKSEKN